MVAPRGSGKTTLVLNLLSKLYRKYFQRVVVFSPTMHGDTKWETVKKQTGILAKWDDPLEDDKSGQHKKQKQEDSDSDSENEGGSSGRNDGHEPSLYARSWHSIFAKVTPGPVPAMHADTRQELEDIARNRGGAKMARGGKTKKFTGKLEKKDLFVDVFEEDLSKVMKESMDSIDTLRKKGHAKNKAKRTLIVFDDLVGSPLFGNQQHNAFRRLNATQRHYSISTLMCTQQYKAIPKLVRVNATVLIVFEVTNQSELECIYEEASCGLTKDEWLAVYQQAISKPFGFMVLNWQKPKGERVWIGFDQMVPVAAREDVKRIELQKEVAGDPRQTDE